MYHRSDQAPVLGSYPLERALDEGFAPPAARSSPVVSSTFDLFVLPHGHSPVEERAPVRKDLFFRLDF